MGGAVFNSGGTVSVTDSTFSGNTATGGAGGGYNAQSGSGLGAQSSTRAAPSPSSAAPSRATPPTPAAGSIPWPTTRVPASLTVTNTVIGQSDTNAVELVSVGAGGTANSGGTGDLIHTAVGFGGTVVSTADPLLGPLADNGGPPRP